MKKGMVTFRLDSAKMKKLDTIAASLDRDRSYILNEAVSSYLETHHWQVAHIKKGLQEADARRFASEKDVVAAFAKWR